jgi:hypothetical protein
MIKLNAHSLTSPYRFKMKYSVPVTLNANFSRIEIEDREDDQTDAAAETLKQFRLVRYVFSGLDLTDLERRVFMWRFIEGNSFSKWPGPEPKNQLYQNFNIVLECIHKILYSHGLTKVKPGPFNLTHTKQSKNRKAELIERFEKTRKIHISTN